MREETKSIIYMALDLLESIKSTSSDLNKKDFINIDYKIYEEVKDDLFNLLVGNNAKNEENNIEKKNEKEELIGVLPLVLIDKEKFPSINDIIKLAEYSLNIEGLSKKKRSRNELIGIIVSEIAEKEDKELDVFLSAWRIFMKKKSKVENYNNIINTNNKFNIDNINNTNKYNRDKFNNNLDIKNKGQLNENFVDVWLEFFKYHKG